MLNNLDRTKINIKNLMRKPRRQGVNIYQIKNLLFLLFRILKRK
jgi:hypothetical protein